MIRNQQVNLGGVFCQALRVSPDPCDLVGEDLNPALEGVWARAHKAWPDAGLSAADFARTLGELYAGELCPSAVLDWLAALNASDIYLARASARGETRALAYFNQSYAGLLLKIAGQFPNSQHDAEDLVQALNEQLFLGAETRPARLEQYSGRGALASWLRVTATRYFIDLQRTGAQSTYDSTHFDDVLLSKLPSNRADHELQLLKKTYRAEFKDAFQEAFEGLSSAERNLLRQRVVGELGVRQIGELYGVHGSTISRRLTRLHERLAKKTLDGLEQSLAVDSDAAESIVRLINSQLEVSLTRLLAKTPKTQTKADP